MARYINGVKMGFAMQAYADYYNEQLKREEQLEQEEINEYDKFSNIEIGGIEILRATCLAA